VREALFSMLAARVPGVRVLDLYAGSGALGIEALSRGAASAVFVENGKRALPVLRRNLSALGLEDRSRVVASPCERAVRTLDEPFDLVFCDPPWNALEQAARTLEALRAAIVPEGRVVLEHAARDAPPDLRGMVRLDVRRYGDTALAFFTPAEP
jgi:16S rRNA (guanine966-N2)-methyltransferase